MRPFAECPPEVLRGIRYLLTDVDDTLTENGRLHASTLAALERLDAAGIAVIPVTGGCAGWCDHIARVWPVAAVIGESGAFSFRLSGKRLISTWWDDAIVMREQQKHVLNVAHELLRKSPRAALAQDQSYRLCDVAIDHSQAAALADHEIEVLMTGFRTAGIHAKASSIHINAWLGDFDKSRMAVRLLTEVFGLDSARLEKEVLFVGDAPNDVPMFATFKQTVGVANLQRHLDRMESQPCWLTRAPYGRGIEEIAAALSKSNVS